MYSGQQIGLLFLQRYNGPRRCKCSSGWFVCVWFVRVLVDLRIGIGIFFESVAIHRIHLQMIHRCDFHVHSIRRSHFETVQLFNSIIGSMDKWRKVHTIDSESKLFRRYCNGQFKLLFQYKGELPKSFFNSIPKKRRSFKWLNNKYDPVEKKALTHYFHSLNSELQRNEVRIAR